MDRTGFEVMARNCDQCLCTAKRIVSGRRAAEIIKECRDTNQHFICHKSPPRRSIACHGVHQMQVGQLSRIAERLDMVVLVDPVTLAAEKEPDAKS